jgi:hypothetical protein
MHLAGVEHEPAPTLLMVSGGDKRASSSGKARFWSVCQGCIEHGVLHWESTILSMLH